MESQSAPFQEHGRAGLIITDHGWSLDVQLREQELITLGESCMKNTIV